MKKFVSYVLLTLLLINIVAIGTVAAQPSEKIPVIVGFKEKPNADLIAAHGGSIKYNYKIISAIATSLPLQAIEALKRNPNVLYVELVHEVQAVDTELDNSWGVERIGAGSVHAEYTGDGIQVAVLDTGIDYTHDDLDDNYVGGYDFVNNDNDPRDDNGHGTHCAGIIAAEDDGLGVVGVAPEADLYAVKVLNRRGSGTTDDIIAGIEWAVENGADVISMSLGGLYTPGSYDPFELACNEAYSSGTLVVSAAGNNGIYTENYYPAAYDSVIAVGATDINDNIASFSNSGPFLELVAPGVNVYSTMPTYRVALSRSYGYTYGTLSGTSMACPHVAGVAALVFESGLSTTADVRNALDSTAENLGFSAIYQGNGLVDAEAAVEGTSIGEAPIVSWVNPTEAATVQGSVSIRIDASDLEDSTLTVEWQIDGGAELPTTFNIVTGYYEANWVSSSVTDGPHDLTATTIDSDGNTAVSSISIVVENVNDPPVANAGPDQTVTDEDGNGEETVTLDGSLSFDPEGDALSYEWRESTTPLGTSAVITPTLSVGEHTITLTVTDSGETSSTDTVVITVNEAQPFPEILADITEITYSIRSAGRNDFYRATANVIVTDSGTVLDGATVYGHWEDATTDSEIGITDSSGETSFTSNSVKNPSTTITFTFVVDRVEWQGIEYVIPDSRLSLPVNPNT